jgi:hypothetical protein
MYWFWGLTLWLAATIGFLLGWMVRVRVAEESREIERRSAPLQRNVRP